MYFYAALLWAGRGTREMPTRFPRQQPMQVRWSPGKGGVPWMSPLENGIYKSQGLDLLWLLLCTFIYSGTKQKITSLGISVDPGSGVHTPCPSRAAWFSCFSHSLWKYSSSKACAAVILKQSFQQTICIDLLLLGMEMSYLHPSVLLYQCNSISKNGCFLIVHCA